jgi:hypothetical protein
MINYDEYISKLKKKPVVTDFDRLFARIERRAVLRPKTRLVLAGVLTVLVLGIFAYFFQAQLAGDGDMLMSYVFEQESIDGLLLDYVFEE